MGRVEREAEESEGRVRYEVRRRRMREKVGEDKKWGES